MQIDKQQIVSMLQGLGEHDKAGAADSELPGQVDTDTHAGLLERLGISIPDLLTRLGGQGTGDGGDGKAGGLGGIAGKLGL